MTSAIVSICRPRQPHGSAGPPRIRAPLSQVAPSRMQDSCTSISYPTEKPRMNNTNYSVNDCRPVEFPVSGTDTAFLVEPLRNGIEAPFPVKRMYYLFDIPDNKVRGGHAHKALQQIIIAIKGSFSLKLSDGLSEKIVTLDSPFAGIHLVPGIWRELYDFTPGATCMVLASEVYDEKDYIRR